jgi:hypothetical protein
MINPKISRYGSSSSVVENGKSSVKTIWKAACLWISTFDFLAFNASNNRGVGHFFGGGVTGQLDNYNSNTFLK